MSDRLTLDVSRIPTVGFGNRSVLWWSTACVMAIEGTVFAMAIAAYFYFRGNEAQWPPASGKPPSLLWGTLNVAVLLVSLIPNHFLKGSSEEFRLDRVRRWSVVAIGFAVVFNVVRAMEFTALNVNWNSNAYGSITWTLLGLHTAHILTDMVDTVVLTVLFFTGPVEEKRFVDMSENCFYWYFVVLTWLPIYAVVYLVPRMQ